MAPKTKAITKKALKEFVHDKAGLDMNISGDALNILAGIEEGKAKTITELAGRMAKDFGRKTIQDKHVQLIMDTMEYVEKK